MNYPASNGTFIGLRGIGGIVFSRGLDTIAALLEQRGWQTCLASYTQGEKAAEWAKDKPGPIVVMWHSAGAHGGKEFARALGQPIDLAISVDAWMPNQKVDPAYRRVISVVAEHLGRFHVEGPNVARKVKVRGTSHTTVDDAAELVKILQEELARLAVIQETPAMLPAPAKLRSPQREKFNSAFFAELRLAWGGLSQTQVDNCNAILDAFESHGDGSDKTLAYALATARHEVGPRMKPVRETFAETDAEARAAVAGRKYGKPAGPYGHVYYGRGLPQLTWHHNYKGSSSDAGVDLEANPDAMLDTEISARVLIRGLQDGRWNAQKKGISFYLPPTGEDDLENARRTVNITDRWKQIADHYAVFLKAAEKGRVAAWAARASHLPDASNLPSPDSPQPAKPRDLDQVLASKPADLTLAEILMAVAWTMRDLNQTGGQIVDLLPAPATETRNMNSNGKAALASSGILGGLLAVVGTIGQVVTGIGGSEVGDVVTQAQGDIPQIIEHVSQIVTAVGAIMAIIGRWKADKPITGIVKAQ